MTRIGLIGCGRWGKLILRDLLSLGTEVSVCAPSEATRAEALARGAASAHADLASLPDADGYVVAPPTVLHAEITEALIPRGRPIFVEKPLTADPASAARIAQAAPDRVFCMEKWRYHGGVMKLADLARSGALGEIRAVRSWRLGWDNPHRDVDSAWILAPHDLSIALEILGRIPEPVSAIDPDASGDSLLAVLRDESGARVTLEISSGHPVPRRSVVVIGTAGAAQFGDSYDDAIVLRREGEAEERAPVETEMPLLAELRAFVEHLSGGPPPRTSAPEAAEAVRVLARLREMAGLTGR